MEHDRYVVMAECGVVVHRGYCSKSPPRYPPKRWQTRWCTLSVVNIPNVSQFHKKYSKLYKEKYGRQSTSQSPFSVFAYYKQPADEAKHKSLNRFIIDNAELVDTPSDLFPFVISIKFPSMYNNRQLLLGFSDQTEHKVWLESLTYYKHLTENKLGLEECRLADVTESESLLPTADIETDDELISMESFKFDEERSLSDFDRQDRMNTEKADDGECHSFKEENLTISWNKDGSIVLYRGYCIKSPPVASHRWRSRWCTLTITQITDKQQFYRKYYKKFKKKKCEKICDGQDSCLVLSYYKEKSDEIKEKPINKLIIDSTAVSDFPGGVRKYRYAIKLQLSEVYDMRVLYLCFSCQRQHGLWLKAFEYHRSLSDDKLNFAGSISCTHSGNDSKVNKNILF